jgi:hypothetical protein
MGSFDNVFLNLVLVLRPVEVVSAREGKFTLSDDADTPPLNLVLTRVENHMLSSFLQWFSKAPSKRIIELRT